MAPSHETIAHNQHETTEWLILHKPSGTWASLTFQKGNHSTVQVVTDNGITSSMTVDNGLMTLQFTMNCADFEVTEV